MAATQVVNEYIQCLKVNIWTTKYKNANMAMQEMITYSHNVLMIIKVGVAVPTGSGIPKVYWCVMHNQPLLGAAL